MSPRARRSGPEGRGSASWTEASLLILGLEAGSLRGTRAWQVDIIFFLKKALWTFGLQSQTAVNFELESFLNSVETRLSVYRTG